MATIPPLPPLPPAPGLGQLGADLPPGSVILFAGDVAAPKSIPADDEPQAPVADEQHTTLPEAYGYLVCDGRRLAVRAYPLLFEAIGYLYGGSGDTFQAPDLRGWFVRGVAVDGEQDPGLDERQAAPRGKATGVGSTQEDALREHYHTLGPAAPGNGATNVVGLSPPAPPNKTGPPVDANGQASPELSGAETRARNVALHYLIKYR